MNGITMTDGVYKYLREREEALDSWATTPLGLARTGVQSAKDFYDGSVFPLFPGVVSEDRRTVQLEAVAAQLNVGYDHSEDGLNSRQKFTNYMVESSIRFSEENRLCYITSEVLVFLSRDSLLEGNYITRLNGKIINLVDRLGCYDLARFSHKIACVAANALYALTMVSMLAGLGFMSASALSIGAGITVATTFFLASYVLKDTEVNFATMNGGSPVHRNDIEMSDEALDLEGNPAVEEDRGVEEAAVAAVPHCIHADFRAVLQSAELYSVIVGVVTKVLVYPIAASFVGACVFYQHYVAIPRDVALGVHQAYLEYRS